MTHVKTGFMRGAAVSAALAGGLAVAGCGSQFDFAPDLDIPESEAVETAPWPRLIDAPPPVSRTASEATADQESVEELTAKGAAIQSALAPRIDALRAEETALQEGVVVRGGDYGRAARLRAQGRALAAE